MNFWTVLDLVRSKKICKNMPPTRSSIWYYFSKFISVCSYCMFLHAELPWNIFFKLLMAICHTIFIDFLCFLQFADQSSEQTYFIVLACWRGLDWMHLGVYIRRLEAGLLVVCWDIVWIYQVQVSREIAQFSSTSRTRTYAPRNSGPAQHLNVRQRKKGTIIIQAVRILQHSNLQHGHSNLLPNNLARQ